MSNMDAESVADYLLEVRAGVSANIVIWRVPQALRGSDYTFKYRVALIADGVCVLRYDNEAGKGDHRHLGHREFDYDFRGPDDLLIDFWRDVERWLQRSGR